MGSRGAFLAPVLLPTASCFVNLPAAFVQSFIESGRLDRSGATVLELSWETEEGYVQRVCAGWIGGITRDGDMRGDTIELSAEFARCIGLQEHLARLPQTFVGVHVAESLPSALQVHVDPCTPDDWELIQLHAGVMENEFLRQMCVVNDGQIHPIWVQPSVVIRLRVTLDAGVDFARLTPQTEVIVAPNERKPAAAADSTLDPEFYYEVSPPLRLQPTGADAEAPENDELWIHAATAATLDGALVEGSKAPIVAVAVWKEPDSAQNAEISPRVAVLRTHKTVALGRVVLSASLATVVGASTMAPSATLRMRVLRIGRLPVSSIRLHVLPEELAATDAATIASRFLEWSQQARDGGVVLQSGSLVSLGTSCIVDTELEENAATNELEAQLQDIPTGALTKYAVVGGSHGDSLRVDQVHVRTASTPQQLEMLRALRRVTSPEEDVAQSLRSLARQAPAYNATLSAIRSTLSRDESAGRVLLAVKPPGSVLLHGDRGSGKTTIVTALGEALRVLPTSLATPLYTDCRSLRGLKMETAKQRLSDLVADATACAPAVVLLDNLDALIPAEDETAGAANEQARRLAEHVVTLLQQSRERSWKTTLELKQQVREQLVSCAASRAAAQCVLETVGAAMLSKSVVFVATARSDAAVHPTLRATGLFDRPIQVLAPTADQREGIIRDLLQLKLRSVVSGPRDSTAAWSIDSSVDFGLLASLTEGFSLRDLANVTDRSLHQFFLRRARAHATQPTMQLLQVDYTKALEGFQPTALVGVDLFKSSVEWSDVGGLSSVRDVLKDTLELPTRYAKLYDQTPIKLPAGMLLYGPPGCGKTLLASAVAHECGLNFISVKGPEVLNKYIGASEQAIRDLFARAASAAPSVLFLDEFDSIAPRRGADNTGVTDRLVNQLLTFLDGVESRKGVYVLAATSRPDMIDPALLRPGRLDKSLYCGFPTRDERVDILRAVARKMELSEDAQLYLSEIASAPKSALFSGADLQALMYSAQLELVHDKLADAATASPVITRQHLETAFNNAKPSTSEAARRDFDAMYASFSKARNTDFSVAAADASVDARGLQAHKLQRIMSNIVGFSSLRDRGNGNGNGDDDGRDPSNQYYAGGASQQGGGSGLSVIGPGGDGDSIANIIERARQQAQAEAGGDQGAAASDQPRHVITFFREGFTVNDGPYRARSDPANRPFLEAIERGMVPRELEGENRNEQVEINLVDRRHEDYKAPPAPAYTAFAGQGQTIGSASYAADAVVSSASEVSASSRPVVDDKQPTTTLQIRLHNGTRLRETLNLTHTIRDLHAIIHLNGAGAQAYTLLAGFPPRPVSTQMDQTIDAAGLKGAAVTQKLV
ncbi:hypothetical protein ATCC90586_009584 [Pythium insidiosum]|nr:hypothetical protein ATCC90586_009584 [Pythium insidiosum]